MSLSIDNVKNLLSKICMEYNLPQKEVIQKLYQYSDAVHIPSNCISRLRRGTQCTKIAIEKRYCKGCIKKIKSSSKKDKKAEDREEIVGDRLMKYARSDNMDMIFADPKFISNKMLIDVKTNEVFNSETGQTIGVYNREEDNIYTRCDLPSGKMGYVIQQQSDLLVFDDKFQLIVDDAHLSSA